MPYITQSQRKLLHKRLKVTSEKFIPKNAGELNYIISIFANNMLKDKGLNYATISEISAAINDCHDEFKRRIMGPYEDVKILQNGDVYSFEFLKEELNNTLMQFVNNNEYHKQTKIRK